MSRLWCCVCLVAMIGCGGASDAPRLVAASGTVFYKDAPVSGAVVTFEIEKSPIAVGTTNAEGKFTVTTGGRPGASLGAAKVGIIKAGAAEQDMTSMKPEDMKAMQMKNAGSTPMAEPEIPVKYGDPLKSGLTADLDKDGSKNVFEFRLQD